MPPSASTLTRVHQLTVRNATLALEPPIVMGVVNVTPDSFSDGGRFEDSARALAHGVSLQLREP